METATRVLFFIPGARLRVCPATYTGTTQNVASTSNVVCHTSRSRRQSTGEPAQNTDGMYDCEAPVTAFPGLMLIYRVLWIIPPLASSMTDGTWIAEAPLLPVST